MNLKRYYLASSGYIVDSSKDKLVVRVKDIPDWREKGEGICEKLGAEPENERAIIESFSEILE